MVYKLCGMQILAAYNLIHAWILQPTGRLARDGQGGLPFFMEAGVLCVRQRIKHRAVFGMGFTPGIGKTIF